MTNENLETMGNGAGEITTDVVDAMAEMKKNYEANYVSREKYDQTQAVNKKLLDAMITGKSIDAERVAPKTDVNQLRKELYGKDSGKLSSVEYIQKTLDLRNALIEAGERDPFIPVGNHAETTAAAIESAQRVAEGLQSMLDFAEGDEGIFLAEYQRRVVDPKIPVGNRKRK